MLTTAVVALCSLLLAALLLQVAKTLARKQRDEDLRRRMRRNAHVRRYERKRSVGHFGF